MGRKIALTILGVLALALLAGAGWLTVAPPELLRVADNFAAKFVCSNVFLAGRPAEMVLQDDIQAPGNPILRTVRVDVDREQGVVTARILGLFATGWAVYRPGLGCASVPDGNIGRGKAIALDPTPAPAVEAPLAAEWPLGESAGKGDERLANVLDDAALTGPGMRAVVVVHDGRIVGERYGEGFSADTPLLGWSLSKTVNAILIGRLIQGGRLSLRDSGLVPQWAGDERERITLGDMTEMMPGLAFDEEDGDLTDATRMLFLEPDMAAFVADKKLTSTPGTVFNYSTGTAVLLSRIWMNIFPDPRQALAYPGPGLFQPLGMRSAVFEADEAGTIVGGAYMYATARDWARIGQFLLQDGVWDGQRLLPEGFVRLMDTPNGDRQGYSLMQSWTIGPVESDGVLKAGLPEDTFWLRGRDGQTVAVIPSKKLVVVRMGLTPWKLGYAPEKLSRALVDALE